MNQPVNFIVKRKILALAITQVVCLSPAQAATITVDDAGDSGGSNCTLRAAIESANTDVIVDGCVAGSGVDTIVFDPSIVPGTITLSGTQLSIDSSMTIEGPVADQLTIDADGASRHFLINDRDSMLDVRIDQLTLSGGSAISGGSILSTENLTMTHSTLTGNSAGISGGGIAANDGAINLTNSTLTGNSAGGYGGGIYAGGGIINLTNTTLTGSTAIRGGGVYAGGGTINLSNSLIANSVLGNDCEATVSDRVSLINSLIADGSCYATVSGDPMLGPLQDNGGPSFTHALGAGSPAIDAGDDASCPSTDQTGMPRPIDGDSNGIATCDIGAFEFVDIFGPIAVLTSAPDVMTLGGTSYQLTITYTDDAPIDIDSIDVGDISLTPTLVVASVDVVIDVEGTVAQVDYTLTPPGGQWDVGDIGLYVIALNADEVFDQSSNGNNATPGGTLGSFAVTDNSAPEVMDASFNVVTGAAVGTAIGQVMATDIDNNIPTSGAWQITAGNGSSAYAIDDDGIITVADTVALADAVLTVEVTDTGDLSDTATVTITRLSDAMFADGFENL